LQTPPNIDFFFGPTAPMTFSYNNQYGLGTGLCSSSDGFAENDYLSSEGVLYPPNSDAQTIYKGFAESCNALLLNMTDSYSGRVPEEDILFDTPFAHYEANFPSYTKNWNPELTAPTPTADAISKCSKFDRVLEQLCIDDMSEDQYDFEGIIRFWRMIYILYGYMPIPDDYLPPSFDFHADYSNISSLEFEDFTQVISQSYGASVRVSLGGTYIVTYKSDLCDAEEVNATIIVNCGEAPSVTLPTGFTVYASNSGVSEEVPFPYIIVHAEGSRDKLEYSWKFLDYPKANPNDTIYHGYLNIEPESYSIVDDFVFVPQYPGLYL
jgi:hypothetical protein